MSIEMRIELLEHQLNAMTKKAPLRDKVALIEKIRDLRAALGN